MSKICHALFQPLILIAFVILPSGVKLMAQPFISGCEPVPNNACPSTCDGGTLVVKIFSMARMPIGTEIQAELSDPTGSFASGTQILPFSAYSTDNGTSYTPGPYLFGGDVSGLFAKITIPAGTAPGTAYSLRLRGTDGTISNDRLTCPAAGRITVTSSGNTLPTVPQTKVGIGQWLSHVYTWTPTTTQPLTTDALVNAQDFFNSANYLGHIVYNTLNLDHTFTNTGMPGPAHDGTSIACGSTVFTKFSMRMRRRETFAPGYYTFTIGADDGVRLSLDGGATWVLSSWVDQEYASSVRSTSSIYPNGICLSGPTDIVLEYYQNPQLSRFTFAVSSTALSFAQPVSQATCEGANASFRFGNADPNGQYQWQVSTDGGITFTNLSDGAVYGGATSFDLSITNAAGSLNGNIYRCLLTNNCVTDFASDTAGLRVSPGNSITQQPVSQTVCPGRPAKFSIAASGSPAYQWQVNAGTGFVDANLSSFTGANTDTLTVLANPQVNMEGWRFRCLIMGSAQCAGQLTSDEAVLSFNASIQILQSPGDAVLCNAQPVGLSVTTSSPGSYQWQVSSDDGTTWIDLVDAPPYSGSKTDSLMIADLPQQKQRLLFRAAVSTDCQTAVFSAPASVSKCCTVGELPNIFTPNGDGVNDAFGHYSCALQNFSMKIYNRWGKLVSTLTDAARGWDGTGSMAGVYFYQVQYFYQGATTSTKGLIELVR